VIVPGVLSADEVQRARADLAGGLAETPTGRNDFEGFSTQGVYALFAKTRAFDDVASHPLLVGVLDHVLGHYQLRAPPGIPTGPAEKAQVLQREESVYPLPRPHPTVVLNSIWPLDDFSEANGATRLVPGSHRWEGDERPPDDAATVIAEMPAGSVM